MGAEFGLVWCCFLLPLHPRYYSAYRHGHRRNADSLESTTNSGNFQGEIGIRTLDSFFRCPLSASKHRHPCRGATHPPLTHRPRNSPSAQTPSLSSPDEPIVFSPDKLSCYTGSPYSAQITPAQTYKAYTPTHKGEGPGREVHRRPGALHNASSPSVVANFISYIPRIQPQVHKFHRILVSFHSRRCLGTQNPNICQPRFSKACCPEFGGLILFLHGT